MTPSRERRVKSRLATLVALIALASCGSSNSPASGGQGGEGQSCYPNDTCNAGLTCLSHLCVNAGVDAAANLDAAASPDANSPDANSGLPDAGPMGNDAATASDGEGTDGSSSGPCSAFTTSTVASMRGGHASGCFELDNVVSLGVTTGPMFRLFVQDSVGGDFSAMRATCSADPTHHPCPAAMAVAGIASGHSVTLKGSYVYTVATLAEDLYVQSITDNGIATVTPAPGAAAVSDVDRGSTSLRLSYQRVSVPPGQALGMYDWTPPEFTVAGATQCPYQLGFGMLQVIFGPAPTGCANSTSQPPYVPMAGGSVEVLIGQDFATFTPSTDCRCAPSTAIPSVTKQVNTLSGILVWSVAANGIGFMYVAPQTNNDFQ